MTEEIDHAEDPCRPSDADPGNYQPAENVKPGEPLPRPVSRGRGDLAFDEDDIDDDDDGFEREP